MTEFEKTEEAYMMRLGEEMDGLATLIMKGGGWSNSYYEGEMELALVG